MAVNLTLKQPLPKNDRYLIQKMTVFAIQNGRYLAEMAFMVQKVRLFTEMMVSYHHFRSLLEPFKSKVRSLVIEEVIGTAALLK